MGNIVPMVRDMALVRQFRDLTQEIGVHQDAITDLASQRAGVLRQLADRGRTRRALAELLGISAPRITQILKEEAAREELADLYRARGFPEHG